jgi:hypothetical protein
MALKGNPGGFDNKFSTWRWEFDNKLLPERRANDKLMYCTFRLAMRFALQETWDEQIVISTFSNFMLDVFQNKSFSRWITVQALK